MKVIWSAADIRAGRIVGRPQRKERWMIGYRSEMTTDQYTLNSLTDGMVNGPYSKESLATFLNEARELPVELLP